MNDRFFDRLLKIRNTTVRREGEVLKYRLVSFTKSTMAKDAIPGTPFRTFQSVPQGRVSKRKQNDTMSFDPYVDTLFDYPLIVNNILGGSYDALNDLNWHLTLQVPYCGMDCWHCYNDKQVCTAGVNGVLEIEGTQEEYTAKEILEVYADCKKQGLTIGRNYNVLRVSGGEPFLAIELLAELLQLINENGQKEVSERNTNYPIVIWTETNLIPWAETEDGNSVIKVSREEANKHGLNVKSIFRANSDRLIIHPCFHGLTDDNLQQCTGNKNLSLSDLQSGFRRLHEFVNTAQVNERTVSPNIYPTFIAEACDPNGIKNFFDFLYDTDHSYPLKVAVISVDAYEPLEQRIADRQKKAEPLFCYAKYASLRRWDDLIKSKYGVAYGQIPRPMADKISEFGIIYALKDIENHDYEPVLILLKSVFRDEYHQELLTILAAPPGIRISTAYDNRHIDLSTRICLKAGVRGLDTKALTVLIVYSNPDSSTDQGRYLPLRWGILKDVYVTEQLVHFDIQLGEYFSLWPASVNGNGAFLEDFSFCMREYFGNRILLERPKIRWVLLGEKNYLLMHENPPKLSLEKAWDTLLCSMQSLGFSGLVERSIFLQVLNVPASQTENIEISLKEGENTTFRVRYYIPNFNYYDKNSELNDSRSLNIISTDESLSIEEYKCRPLSKYGEIHFSVVCGELSHSRKAAIILESKKGSPYCPRLHIPFVLKKVMASDV